MKLGLGYKQGRIPFKASIISLMLLLAVFCCCAFSPGTLAEEPLRPEQIILTWTSDPATSQTITWLMADNLLRQVQYMKENEFNGNFDLAQQINVNGTIFTNSNYRYTANLSGLTPNTKYIYRVGSEGIWSGNLSFTTAADTEKITFLYLGDVQAGYTEWGNMLNSIENGYPQIKFSLLGGDLTNNGSDENEWGQFLNAASGYFSKIPLMPTFGNHDGSMYLNFFALPTNGPTGLEKEFYSFDYGNAHFVVLNSSNNTNAAAKRWLQADLQSTTKSWKFVMFHHPAYPAFEDYKPIDESICENWVPILEDNGVDMVFVGHQHLYMRTYPIYRGQLRTDPSEYGIVYVMGNSGSKTYASGGWLPYIAKEETGSNYQIININGNVLNLTSKTANGELIENYTINKSIPIALTDPAPDKEFMQGEQVSIKGMAEDALTSIKVKVTDPDGQIIYGPVNVNIVNRIFETSFTLDSGAKIGTYTILVGESLPNAITGTFVVKLKDDGQIPAEDIILTITGNGVTTEVEFTLSQLEKMQQYRQKYSTINTFPTKKFYLAEGVRLNTLLQKAGIKDEARLITFKAKDGFTKKLTREQLDAVRYYYPGLKENHEYFGYIPGSTAGAKEVAMMLALKSVEGSDNPSHMSSHEAPLLVMGQEWITEQTNEVFVKNVRTITVSTDMPDKWENPAADRESGIVPEGTKVALSTSNMNEDSIHYTTDGTNPTIKSPIYNWVKKRWWRSRSDELAQINKPIKITSDIIIKAITIGPGKEDSDIVTFDYKIPVKPAPDLATDTTNNIVGQDLILVFTDDPAWREVIREVVINGSTLDAGQYSKDNPGKITINGNVFSTPGEYVIVIKAVGYADAGVTHEMIAPVILTTPTSSHKFAPGEQITIKGTAQYPLTSLQVKVFDPNKQLIYGPIDLLVADEKFETSFTLNSSAQVGIYTINIDGAGLPGTVTSTFQVKTGGGIITPPTGDVVLTITGSGVAKEVKLTLEGLQGMNQHQQVYSAINTWPTKKWYVGEGVKLKDLLNSAGMTSNNGLIKLTAADGFTTTLTVKELLNDTRYCFPNFMSNGEGHIPGSSAGAKVVEPIIGLVSADGTDNSAYMNDLNSPLFMLGQRAVTEQNGQLFIKNLSKIEVVATSPSQWETPKADPVSGEVPAGTMVKLSNANMDDDKIHYTTDGSTPTINSPMYNWIANRWWSSRADVLDTINHPIEIKKDTTIKAITIGPGKNDSQVVTFTYKVKQPVANITEKVIPGKESIISLGTEVTILIPVDALKEAAEVKIDKVAIPPAVPTGFRLLDNVYEFSVNGKSNYSFARSITVTLSFNPKLVDEGETPSVYYYDQARGEWVNIGGAISGNTIIVQIDHFTKFAVMVVDKTKLEELEKPVEPVQLVKLTDIAGHWAQNSIEQLVISGAVGGYPDGTFKPNNAITRAEFVTILAKAFKLENKDSKIFADSASHWAKDYIACAAASGIVTGYDSDTFGPDDMITREQMVVMISKVTRLPAVSEEIQFIDSDSISNWARSAIAAASLHGIMRGYPDNSIKPQGNATRAEAVTVIVNALKKVIVVEKTAS